MFQEKDLKDITDEIRKLKAVIVKHENRIRALESAAKEEKIDTVDTSKTTESEKPSSGDHPSLAPDEV